MNNFLKKTISFVLVMIMSVGIFASGYTLDAKGATPIEIGCSLSADSAYKGDTVELKFFFENFTEADVECTAFQLDVYVDPALFSVGSMKCNLDGTNAMMFTTKFNSAENKVKTIYFNTISSLPKDSKDICTMSLTVKNDFDEVTDVQISITLAMALNKDAKHFEVKYSSPVIKCMPLSSKPADSTVVPTITSGIEPVVTPVGTSAVVPPATNKVPETIPPTDIIQPIVPNATTAPEVPGVTAAVPGSTDSVDAPNKTEAVIPPVPTNGASDKPATEEKPENHPDATDNPNSGSSESESEKTKYTVTYRDSNGRIIETEQVEEGRPATNSKVPYRPGYDFLGWVASAGSLKQITCDVTAIAVYELSETLYTIEVTGGTVNGSYTPIKAKYDDCVIVKLDDVSIPEGTHFAGWQKSGCDDVVSYNKTYSFLVNGSVKITPVFSEAPVAQLPQTVLFDRVINTEAVIFTCESFLPADFSYFGSGIIVTDDKSIGQSDELFVLNADGTISYRANNNSVNAQFTVINPKLDKAFYARSYLIYSDKDGNKITVYSKIGIYDPEIF